MVKATAERKGHRDDKFEASKRQGKLDLAKPPIEIASGFFSAVLMQGMTGRVFKLVWPFLAGSFFGR
jgi:hypothetical protein